MSWGSFFLPSRRASLPALRACCNGKVQCSQELCQLWQGFGLHQWTEPLVLTWCCWICQWARQWPMRHTTSQGVGEKMGKKKPTQSKFPRPSPNMLPTVESDHSKHVADRREPQQGMPASLPGSGADYIQSHQCPAHWWDTVGFLNRCSITTTSTSAMLSIKFYCTETCVLQQWANIV